MIGDEPRVLVVDDSAFIDSTVRATLEPHGYAVETALDDAAVALAADMQPAVVLLDLKMPDMDGYEIRRRLRADPHTADIPIIVVSGSSNLTGCQTEGRHRETRAGLPCADQPPVTRRASCGMPRTIRQRGAACMRPALCPDERGGGTMTDTQVRKPPCILVVDDDVAICTLLKDVLEESGYCVETAADGTALRVAADTHPTVVLLDLMMAGTDGYQVGQRLRADPATADIPIIVLSAGARARQAVRQLGADGCLEIPCDLAALLATVAKYAP
jgi:CheY-like chemotaxis protein